MRKLLRPKDLLLLGLAGALDLFEVVRDPFGVAADSYQNLYGWIPEKYKRHNFGRMVERNLKTGEIEKVVKNGEVYLSLTTSGREKTVRDFPMMFLQKQRWDRKWRIVIFDISEVSRSIRDLLRLKLKKLGFGMLQESVWITPHDIILDFREFLKEKGLGDYVYVMEVSHLLAGDSRSLSEKIWHLSRINQDYGNLLEEIKKLKRMYITDNDRLKKCQAKRKEESQRRLERKIKEQKKDLKEKYLGFLLNDPCLPKELLPDNWLGEIVKKKVFKL